MASTLAVVYDIEDTEIPENVDDIDGTYRDQRERGRILRAAIERLLGRMQGGGR